MNLQTNYFYLIKHPLQLRCNKSIVTGVITAQRIANLKLSFQYQVHHLYKEVSLAALLPLRPSTKMQRTVATA